MRQALTTTLAGVALLASSTLASSQAPTPPGPAPATSPPAAQQDPAPPTQTAPTPPPAQAVTAPPPPPAPAAPTRQMTVSALTDKDLEGPNANEVGDIERVVEANADKKQHLVISRGGFLGLFETEVLVPLENVAAQGDKIVLRNMPEDQVKTLPKYDKDANTHRELEGNASVTLSEVK
jgi:sporulation protein YlmC with PRC-barrel domain